MSYHIFLASHSSYMDESENKKIAQFESEIEAINKCKEIVDKSVEDLYKHGTSPDELFSMYSQFGDDPYIISDEGKVDFSSYDYAKKKAKDVCDKDMWYFPPD